MRASELSLPDTDGVVANAVFEAPTRRNPVFTIPWCPYALWKKLHDAYKAGGQVLATIYHPRDQGTARTFYAEYLNVTDPSTDSEWAAGDPIEKVQVRLANVGDYP